MNRPKIVSWQEEDGTKVYKFTSSELPVADGVGIGLLAARDAWTADGCPPSSYAATNDDEGNDEWVAALTEAGFTEVFAQIEMKKRFEVASERFRRFEQAVSCESEHLQSLWELNNVVYAGREFTGVATADGLRDFVDSARDLSLWSTVIDDEGIHVAFAAAHIDEDGIGWLDELSVHPDYRRRGIGRGLLEHTLALMFDRGVECAHLFTDRDNSGGAKPLYEGAGFRIHREMRRFRLPLQGSL